MKISNERPPAEIYDRAVKQSGVDFDQGVVFTVGDTVYTKNPLPYYLKVHEAVHIKQQEGVPDWWDVYFENPEFRYQQELEAYRAQWQAINRKEKMMKKARLKMEIINLLSGPMYDNIRTHAEVLKDLQYEEVS